MGINTLHTAKRSVAKTADAISNNTRTKALTDTNKPSNQPPHNPPNKSSNQPTTKNTPTKSTSVHTHPHKKRLAIIFPGQGSQSVGMLQELHGVYPQVKDTFAHASDALGFDLWAICQNDGLLSQTQYTQPALLTASMAIWYIIKDTVSSDHFSPLYMAGHSLGEYSALCASGVLPLADAVKITHFRGQLMQQAVAGMDTMMAALLGLDDEQVIELCEQVNELHDTAIVDIANFNSAGQVVIAGNQQGVQLAIDQAHHCMGKKAIPLKVSVPAHCQLMQPASDALADILEATQLSMPIIPVIQNRHAKEHKTLMEVKTALVQQLCHPVLWTKTMAFMANKHIDMLIECGAGNVLSNLAKRQTTRITCYPSDKISRLDSIFEALA